MSPAAIALPVTVAATRRPAPGCSAELQEWAAALCAAAARRPGFVSSRVDTGPAGVTAALVFMDARAAGDWERCPERGRLLERAVALTAGAPTYPRPVTPPPRWRTALIVWAGLFPFSLLFTGLAGPAVAGLPVVLQSLASSAVLVPLAVYVGIPIVSALLRRFA